MSTLASRAVYHAIPADFQGVPVVLAVKDGETKPTHVATNEIAEVLGDEFTDQARMFLNRNSISAYLVRDGSRRFVPLIPVRDFFRFCQANQSPLLDRFHDHVADVLTEIQQTGLYVDESVRSDPTVVALQAALKLKVEMIGVKQDVARVDGEVQTLKQRIGDGPAAWGVANWIKRQGHELPTDDYTREGGECGRIAKMLGITVTSYIDNGGSFSAKRWPMKVIREWWPGCCRRHGWPVTWHGID